MTTTIGTPSVRSRSFGGCTTCRDRRTKCDEARPFCGPCSLAGVSCEGYEAKISFLVYLSTDKHFDWAHGGSKSANEPQPGARRQLATDKSRAQMAKAMYDTVSSLNLRRSFAELELHCDRSLSDVSLFRGPFGSFRSFVHTPDIVLEEQLGPPVTKALTSLKRKRTTVTEVRLSSETELPDNDGVEDCAASSLKLSITRDATGYEVSDLESLEAAFVVEPIIDDEVPSRPLPEVEEELIALDRADDFQELIWSSPRRSYSEECALSASLSALESNHPDNILISTVDHLLDHYRNQMGRLFSPLRIRNSPWAVQQLPSVMSTLSDLTAWNWVSPIRLSLFNSLLAVSAFNLDRIGLQRLEETDLWWAIGSQFKVNAIKQTQLWLSTGLHGPKVSKYKENLMAFLTLVTITETSGLLDESRSFLLDTEKYILLHGNGKAPKSRKVATLHHIFLFLRVIEESTFIYPPGASCKPPAHREFNPSTLRFPSLKTHSYTLGLDLDGADMRDFEFEYVELDGRKGTMFAEVYGIDAGLLSLISKTTALANHIMAEKDQNNGIPTEVIRRSKALENEITAWKWDALVEVPIYDEQGREDFEINKTVMMHLATAIHRALLIYLYRRVFDLHSSMLQGLVDEIIQSIYLCREVMIKAGIAHCGIVWPGFMAASEALGEERQAKLLDFLRKSADISGFRSFDVAADVAQEVWKLRRERDPDITWVDIVRDQGKALILS